MSKGKELEYSVNRSFEKIKLLLFPADYISGEITDILLSVAQLIMAGNKGESRCKDGGLSDVSGRELITEKFCVTCYSNIEQTLG